MSGFVQSRSVYDGSTSLAYNSNNTSGNLLVAWIMFGSGTLTSVTDTRNTWTVSSAFTRGITIAHLAYTWNCGAGANTVALGGTLGDIGFTIYEFSGIQTSSDPLDGSITATNPASSTTPASSNFTTSVTGLHVVGICDDGTGQSSLAAGTSYTLGEQQLSHFHGDEYRLTAAAGTYSAGFTCGVAVGGDCIIVTAAFKDASASTASSNFPRKDRLIVPLI